MESPTGCSALVACAAPGRMCAGGPLGGVCGMVLLERRTAHLIPACPPAGAPMVAQSWQEMRCPETQGVEKRKVAKAV